MATLTSKADTLLSTSAYNYTGSSQSYTVPAGTDYIVVKAWGAGGGLGVYTAGGGGALATGSFNVTPGWTMTVLVGGAGSGYATGGWPGGGSACGLGGAGGGGYSRVTGPGVELIAGAGGGGGNGYNWGGVGGAGGAPNGSDGGGPGAVFGGGGTQTAGGFAGSGDIANGYAGGFLAGGGAEPTNDGYVGGGGGGGLYGGGGGGAGTWWNGGGGGGGGSSYIGGNVVTASYATSYGNDAGGKNDPDYPGNYIAYGGFGGGVYIDGHDGYVLIRAYQRTSPPSFSPAPSAQSAGLNQYVSYQVNANGMPTPTYSASGLPPGLSINTTTGLISGYASTAGTFSPTLYATNSFGTATASISWTVAAPQFSANVVFSNTNPIPGDSISCSRSAWASFGVAWTENKVWPPSGPAVNLGNGPAGGNASFTATQTGTYSYQLRVVDIYYNFTDYWFTLTVVPPLVGAPTSVAVAVDGSTFVTLNWSGASAQVGIAHYNVYRNGSFIGSTASTTFTDSTVSPLTSYTYSIYTVDMQNNVSPSSPTVSTTTVRPLEVFTPLL
jgi:hypothetical protein